MRLLLISMFFIGFAFASSELVSPHFIIIYDDPALADYAQELANEAELALQELSEVFSTPKNRIVINLDSFTDSFNAFASPLPRSSMSFRPLYNGNFSSLYTVIVHELTHIKQFAFDDGVNGEGGILFGLDFGLAYRDISALPPAWFIEGIATWMESKHAPNGRLYSSSVKQLIESLVLGDNWPSLEDLSVADLEAWPAGAARYYLGVYFIEYLVQEYGFDKIIELLKNYNDSYPISSFSQNWQKVTGSSLYKDYNNWTELTKQRAQSRLEKSQKENRLSSSGWYKGSLALSPSGNKLAYSYSNPDLKEGYLYVADYDGHSLSKQRIASEFIPASVAWLNDDELVYNRLHMLDNGAEYYDLYSLDTRNGSEKRLTNGARAQFPKTHNACVYYAQNLVTSGSKIMKYCSGKIETVFELPTKTFVNSLDISPKGKIAFSIVYDGVEDVAILSDNGYKLLSTNHRSTRPIWQGESKLLFISDQSGISNLYSFDLSPDNLTRISNSFGGVLSYSAIGERIVYYSFTANGVDLFGLEPIQVPSSFKPRAIPVHNVESIKHPTHEYKPLTSLEPYGWMPDFAVAFDPLSFGLGATVLGADYSLRHFYSLSGGYNISNKSFYSNFSYGYADVLNKFYLALDYSQGSKPFYQLAYERSVYFDDYDLNLEFVVSGDMSKVYPELRTGARLGRNWANGTALLLELNNSLDYNQNNANIFSHSSLRYSFPVDSARQYGNSQLLLSLATDYDKRVDLRLGYEHFYKLKKIDLDGDVVLSIIYDSNFAKSLLDFGLDYRYRLPLKLRYDDGLYGLEHIYILPSLLASYDLNKDEVRYSADLSLSAEFMFFYNLPISLDVSIPVFAADYNFSIKTELSLADNKAN